MSTVLDETAQRIGREFVNKAREFLEKGDGDLERATYYLDKAQGKGNEQLANEIEELRARISRSRKRRVQALEKKIQAALKAEPFEEGAVQALVDELEQVAPRDERIEVWRREVVQRAAEWREAQEIAQITEEITGLLARAKSLEEGSASEEVIKAYKDAVEAASVAKANYPDSNQVILLHSRARRENNQFRSQENLLTTLQATGNFREVLVRIREHEDDPDKRFPVYDNDGRLVERMKVNEAKDAYERQASIYVQGKTPDKIADARSALHQRHSPEAAAAILDEFELKVAGLMPDPEKQAIDEFRRKHIRPAQKSRDKAARLLREAEAMPRAEIMKAWKMMQEARKEDPHTPGLDPVQKTLRERLRAYVTMQLEEAAHWLDEQQVAQAERRAQAARDAAALDDALRDSQKRAADVIRRVEAAKGQSEDVEHTLEKIEGLLARTTEQEQAGREAKQTWLGLKDRLGKDVTLYPEVSKLGVRIGAFLDVAQLTSSVEEILEGHDESALEDALASIDEMTEAHPDEKATLDKCKARIEARLAFLQAERELAVGSLSRAERLLKTATHGDDRGKAEDHLRQLREAEKRDREAQRELQIAQSLLDKNPEQAYQHLVKWRRDRLLPSRDRIADAWQQLTATWCPEVEKSLERLLSAPAGQLDVRRIRFLVDALTDMDVPQAASWRQRAIPRCYAQLAEDLEELEQWADAKTMWGQAVEAASALDLPKYRARLRNAQLQSELQEIDTADHGDAILDKLKTLETRYPRSVDVKLPLAKAHLARREMEEARATAQSGLALEPDDHYQPAFQDVLDSVAEWEVVSVKQASVERLLDHRRSAEDYAEAKRQALEIAQDHPHLERELDDWWRELRITTLERLERALETKESSGATIWEQMDTVSKLLRLDGNHAQARSKLIQLSTGVEALSDTVKALEDDPHAAGYEGEPAKALGHQLGEVSTALTRAREASRILDHFGRFLDGADDDLERLNRLAQRLEALQSKLRKVRAQCSRIRHNLSVAKSSGDWSTIEGALAEIKALDYDQHVTARYLERSFEGVKKRRSRLEQLKMQIEDDWRRDQFRDVLVGLSQMMDRDSGDPRGEFGIGPTVELSDRDGRRTLATGIRDAERLVKHRQSQVDRMEAWLQRLDVQLDWTAVRDELDSLVNHGHFDLALEHCREVAGSSSDEELDAWVNSVSDEFNDWWSSLQDEAEEITHTKPPRLRVSSLQRVIAYLEHPPISQDRLLSKRARAVWGEASERLNATRESMEEVRQFEKEVQEADVKWQEAYSSLEGAVRTLKKLVSRNGILSWLRNWLNRRQIAAARERASLALAQCKRLCPQHPTLLQLKGLLSQYE